jgi:hypothetical protein
VHLVAVTLPSTVAEHRDLVIRGHVLAKAPGRSEGSRELRDRVVVRSRDTRQRRPAASRKWQTRHAPRPPPRRGREPRASRRLGPLPSVLPGPSRSRSPRLATDRSATAGPDHPPTDAVDREPPCGGPCTAAEALRARAARCLATSSTAGTPPSTSRRVIARTLIRAPTSTAQGPPGRSTTGVAMQSATASSCAHATRAAASCKPRAKADAMLVTTPSAASRARTTSLASVGPLPSVLPWPFAFSLAATGHRSQRDRATGSRDVPMRWREPAVVADEPGRHGPCSGRAREHARLDDLAPRGRHAAEHESPGHREDADSRAHVDSARAARQVDDRSRDAVRDGLVVRSRDTRSGVLLPRASGRRDTHHALRSRRGRVATSLSVVVGSPLGPAGPVREPRSKATRTRRATNEM